MSVGGCLVPDEADEIAEGDVDVEQMQPQDGLLEARQVGSPVGAGAAVGDLEPIGVAR
jgi:hypothetical protein